jgi:dynein heavy chain 2
MANQNDPRKEYVVQCIISALNIPRNDFRSNTASNAALERFLDDPHEKVLQAVETAGDKAKRTVTLAPGFTNVVEGCTEIHFVKLSTEPLTEENIKTNVMISSLRQSPVTLMNDPRKEYILQCVSSVLNIPRNLIRLVQNCEIALGKFLDDPNEKILQAVEMPGADPAAGRLINLACNFETYADGSNEVHFVKLSYVPLSYENLSRDVLVSSLRMSPARSLFYSVRDIFMPLLVQSSGKAEALEGRLADCLVEMEAGLSASLRRGLMQRQNFDEADLSGILTPIDEVRFWSEYKSAAGIPEASVERATSFAEVLTPISSDVEDMNKKSLPMLMDAMDTMMDTLDSLWQTDAEPRFPQARMHHFLKLIAGQLGRSVQAKLNSLNVWTSAFSQVSKHIREGVKVCEKWNEICMDLTSVQWRSTENRWEGEPYKDAFLASMAQRISEVSQLRSQHDQILKLLSEDELKVLQVESCFEPFAKLSAFSYNDYTVPMWKSALSEYEVRMAPIEAKVAERLRSELFASTSNPAQTVRVFQRYQDLLERKNIRESLTNERERLLTELGDFIERILHEVETFDPSNLPGGRGLSLHARKMMWVEHLRSKADLAARPLTGFLKDLQNVSKLSQSVKRVRQDLKEYRGRTFKEWQDEVESQLNDPDDPIALEMNSRVMDFDTAGGALKITYSERLILLVKEARLFEQMGCTIPKKVKQAVENGMKFYRFAVQLKQICNFYNHLSAELLPSQKFMVLQPALA